MTKSTGKSALLIIFFLVAGFIVGGMIAEATHGIPFLTWLSYGKSIGLDAGSPAVLDLALFKLAFGFEMNLNVSEILFMLFAFFLARRFR